MSLSLGEVESLAKLAARGAGLSWGIAEEAGYAARWLEARQLGGLQALCWSLSSPDRGRVLHLGAGISDLGVRDLPVTIGPATGPLLLLPFMAASLSDGESLVLQVAKTTLQLCNQGTDLDQPLPEQAEVSVLAMSDGFAAAPCVSRASGPSGKHLEKLRELSARTYAPATEASRLAGAGAGVLDSD